MATAAAIDPAEKSGGAEKEGVPEEGIRKVVRMETESHVIPVQTDVLPKGPLGSMRTLGSAGAPPMAL